MDGSQKLLLPFHGAPLVFRSVTAALEAGIERVAIITGACGPELEDLREDLDVELVENLDYATGMASSVRTAIDWAEPLATGLLLLLGDEPGIDPAVVRTAITAWSTRPDTALRVRYSDRPGHPVILPLPLGPDRRPCGDSGMREFLTGATEIRVDSRAPVDVDTEMDYHEALARLRH